MSARRRAALAALGPALLWLGAAELPARDAAGAYKARGLGLDTCASFLGVPETQRGLYYSWLAGYLTAYNYLVRETYSIAEYTGLARTNDWFERYCREHPERMLHEAARQFVAERYRIRAKRGPAS